jgi:hypothetical protein
MNTRRLLEIVAAFEVNGNPYDLAAQIVAEQKEQDAQLAEAAGQPALAATIRAAS